MRPSSARSFAWRSTGGRYRADSMSDADVFGSVVSALDAAAVARMLTGSFAAGAPF